MKLLKWPQILPQLKITQPARGYGLGLLLIFVLSSALVAASASFLMAPTAGYSVQGTLDDSSARQLAEEALDAAQRDILTQQRSGASITTAYRYPSSGTNTIAVPTYPGSGTTISKGTYYVTATHARGFSLVLKANVSVGTSNLQVSRFMQLRGATPTPTSDDIRFYSTGWGQSNRVARAGDVNNDGYDDILIDSGDPWVSGSVYLIMGRSLVEWHSLTDANGDFSFNSLSQANRTVRFTDQATSSVAGVGDVNNDGYDDFVMGRPYTWCARSRACGDAILVLGRSTANWNSITDVNGNVNSWALMYGIGTVDWQQSLGAVVAGAGDVNNDGFDDILIGAPSSSGSRYSGGSPGEFCGAVYLIMGRSAWSNLSVSSAGPGNQIVFFVGSGHRTGFGSSVAAAGDVDNDGYDDFMMTQSRNNANIIVKGRTTAEWNSYSGGFYLQNANYANKMLWFNGWSGSTISGDVNNDGYDDLLFNNGGTVSLILGRTWANWASVTTFSDAARFFRFQSPNGLSATMAGDVNNDGYDDILIGESLNDVGGTNSGAAYIILGRSTTDWLSFTDSTGTINLASGLTDANQVVQLIGSTASEQAGMSVSSTGDVDNDGYDDLLIDGIAPGAELTYLMRGRNTSGWAAITDANARYNLSNI